MMRIFIFILVALAISLTTTFCAPTPSPEQYAAATATLMRANALATLDAVNAENQATRSRMETHATATVIPLAVGVTAATTARDAASAWFVLFGAVLGALVLVALGSAFAQLARTRARIVPRDASGQLPAFWDERTQTLADPSRMIGPAITLPHQPDALVLVARAIHYLETGQVQPLARERVETTDGGADADHLLAAARASLAATATAAMFRPDNAERGRAQKIEVVRQSGGGLPLFDRVVETPITRVVVAGDSAIRAIAEQLGDPIPALSTPGGHDDA